MAHFQTDLFFTFSLRNWPESNLYLNKKTIMNFLMFGMAIDNFFENGTFWGPDDGTGDRKTVPFRTGRMVTLDISSSIQRELEMLNKI